MGHRTNPWQVQNEREAEARLARLRAAFRKVSSRHFKNKRRQPRVDLAVIALMAIVGAMDIAARPAQARVGYIGSEPIHVIDGDTIRIGNRPASSLP